MFDRGAFSFMDSFIAIEMQQGRKDFEERRRGAELRINYGNARSAMNMRGSRPTVKIQTPGTDIVMRHRIANPISGMDSGLPMYSGYGYHLDRRFLSPSHMKPIGPGQMPVDLSLPVGGRDRDRFEPIICEALPKTPPRNKYPIIQKLKSKLKSKLKGKPKDQSKA